MRIILISIISSLILQFSSPLLAATYAFIDKDGIEWFTDKKLTKNRSSHYIPLNRGGETSRLSCEQSENKLAKRMAKYDPIITTYATRYHVNANLIRAIVSVESCYDAHAVSSAGAIGLMQLMPATARGLGVSNSFDVHQNLHAGIKYFATLSKKFHHNHKYALAAYNAGPATVLKYAGIPPYRETQEYVNKVLGKYKDLLTVKSH